MKRRTFLKALGAGVGYLMLPPMAVGRSGVYTAQGLKNAMEKMFTCKVGEPRAYMELTRKAAKSFFTPEAFAIVPKDYEVIRLVYQTFAYAVEGGSAVDAEAKLAQYFYNEFQKIAEDKRPMLVWRKDPEFQAEPITKYGDAFLTKEQIEDEVWKLKDYQPKVKVLGGDWTTAQVGNKEIQVPVGVEYDFNTDSLRYVTDKTMLYKMRMRFNIPELLVEDEYNALAVPEGAYTPRIGA